MSPQPNFLATVDGRDFDAATSFDVINPATGKVLVTAPGVEPDQLDQVFASAKRACREWRSDEGARREALRQAADLLDARSRELAHVLTAEQGKPLADAEREIRSGSVWLRYYADLELPRELIQQSGQGYAEIFRRPLGVVAAITPWNFPIALAMWKVAPALRAGNTVVVKPSPYTPLTTLAIGSLLRDIFPAGVLNVIAGPEPLGAALTAHPVPRKISFTGSTPTGKQVALAAAADLKRVTLELGGNDPALVLRDVDVAEIAEPLFWSAFNNNGQVCLAVKRIYVHESVHDDLVDAIVDLANSAKVGDGAGSGVQLGPVNNERQLRIVEELVADAVHRGAKVAAGGYGIDRVGYFHMPTILTDVSDGFRVVDEEQFGPVLPIVKISDEEEALESANRGNYGLTASVWSSDVDRAMSLATSIDAGQVSVNRHGSGVAPHIPFSGHKWSGLGVENGPWGLYDYTEIQVITAPQH